MHADMLDMSNLKFKEQKEERKKERKEERKKERKKDFSYHIQKSLF
jgi:hypothetical protein